MLLELLQKEFEAAMGNDQAATISRGRLLDRYFGKAKETKEIENKQSFEFVIKQRDDEDVPSLSSPLTVTVETEQPPASVALPLPSPMQETPFTEGTFSFKEKVDEPHEDVLL
jgi:hypothetical protein